jgi:hypothetical protein
LGDQFQNLIQPEFLPGNFGGCTSQWIARVGRPALGRLLVYAGKGEQRLQGIASVIFFRAWARD